MRKGAIARPVLKSLVLLMVVGSVSFAEARSALAQVPVQELTELLSEGAEKDWTEDEKRQLARLLASDHRPAVRFTLAAALSRSAAGTDDELDLIAALAEDAEEPVLRATALALDAHLRCRPALERLRVMADSAAVRELVALCASREVIPATDAILEHLTNDAVESVRVRARGALSLADEIAGGGEVGSAMGDESEA